MLLQCIKCDSDVFYKHKLNKILELKRTTVHLPAQGTNEWLKLRKKCFGGSEIGTLLGLNPYQKVKQLIANKVGLTKFNGNQYTRWGNIFEEVTVKWLEGLFNTKIYEFSSLPGFTDRQRFSPDGIGVFKLKCSDVVKGKVIETIEYIILLLEFKSPACSIPNGITPVHYEPQLMTGLLSVPFSEVGLFVNNMYRKCSYQVLGYNKFYDAVYHKTDKKRITVDNPIACGAVMIYQTDEQKKQFAEKFGFISKDTSGKYEFSDSDTEDEDIYEFDSDDEKCEDPIDYDAPLPELICYTKESIDFGRMKHVNFNEMMKLHDDKLLTLKYTSVVTFYEEIHRVEFLDAQIDKHLEHSKELKKLHKQIYEFENSLPNFVGILPWKLFKADLNIHLKNSEYQKTKGTNGQSLASIIDTNAKILDTILKDSPDIETIYNRFHEIFPYDGKYHDRTLKKNMDYITGQK